MSRASEQDLLVEMLTRLERAIDALHKGMDQRERAKGLAAKPSFSTAWAENSAEFRKLFSWLDEQIDARHPGGASENQP